MHGRKHLDLKLRTLWKKIHFAQRKLHSRRGIPYFVNKFLCQGGYLCDVISSKANDVMTSNFDDWSTRYNSIPYAISLHSKVGNFVFSWQVPTYSK